MRSSRLVWCTLCALGAYTATLPAAAQQAGPTHPDCEQLIDVPAGANCRDFNANRRTWNSETIRTCGLTQVARYKAVLHITTDAEWRDFLAPCNVPSAGTTSVRSPLISAEACGEIRNIEGEGPVTCHGRWGPFVKHVVTAEESYTDDVWILLRFRGLERRRHLIEAHVWTGESPHKRMDDFDQRHEFTNQSESWSHWFKSTTKGSGFWRLGIVLDHHSVGNVVYEVGLDCPKCSR